jgi:nitrate/nitrite transporter NarK
MTTARQKSVKIFYGWWIVLVAGIALSVHSVPIMSFTLGVFLKSLSQEFSWSRTQISLAVTLGVLGVTLAAPFLGWLVDRFGARRVISAFAQRSASHYQVKMHSTPTTRSSRYGAIACRKASGVVGRFLWTSFVPC